MNQLIPAITEERKRFANTDRGRWLQIAYLIVDKGSEVLRNLFRKCYLDIKGREWRGNVIDECTGKEYSIKDQKDEVIGFLSKDGCEFVKNELGNFSYGYDIEIKDVFKSFKGPPSNNEARNYIRFNINDGCIKIANCRDHEKKNAMSFSQIQLELVLLGNIDNWDITLLVGLLERSRMFKSYFDSHIDSTDWMSEFLRLYKKSFQKQWDSNSKRDILCNGQLNIIPHTVTTGGIVTICKEFKLVNNINGKMYLPGAVVIDIATNDLDDWKDGTIQNLITYFLATFGDTLTAIKELRNNRNVNFGHVDRTSMKEPHFITLRDKIINLLNIINGKELTDAELGIDTFIQSDMETKYLENQEQYNRVMDRLRDSRYRLIDWMSAYCAMKSLRGESVFDKVVTEAATQQYREGVTSRQTLYAVDQNSIVSNEYVDNIEFLIHPEGISVSVPTDYKLLIGNRYMMDSVITRDGIETFKSEVSAKFGGSDKVYILALEDEYLEMYHCVVEYILDSETKRKNWKVRTFNKEIDVKNPGYLKTNTQTYDLKQNPDFFISLYDTLQFGRQIKRMFRHGLQVVKMSSGNP